jgi:hypothetical protein
MTPFFFAWRDVSRVKRELFVPDGVGALFRNFGKLLSASY